uniref:Uncharacterized protein n=1 Tax=Musca domestica TaxID=7370 RepID=A0A1I8NH30_MUSDO
MNILLVFLGICFLHTTLSRDYSGPWLVATDKFGFHYVVQNQEYFHEVAKSKCLELNGMNQNNNQFLIMVLRTTYDRTQKPSYKVEEISDYIDYGLAKAFVCSTRLNSAILWYKNGTTTHTYDIPKCCYPQEDKGKCSEINMAGCILVYMYSGEPETRQLL